MSYKERLSHLARGSERSVTGQIADVFGAAIASGEIAPGEKLPPTRALAELAGVNHLTAARAYRQLAVRGLVTARVGRGTFARVAGAPAVSPEAGERDTGWQVYALPEERETYGDRILGEMFRQAGREDVIPLMVGYTAADRYPVERLRSIAAEALAEAGPGVHQYCDIEGLEELREEIASLHRADGCEDSADEIVVTNGACQALTLIARAILRPGHDVACESPTFPGVISALRDAGAAVLPVPVDDDGLDVDELERLVRRREIRLVLLQPRIHNPTGRDLAPERRERLCELARRYGFFIIEDGVYAPLRFEGESPPPLRALEPSHVIYVSSLSKTVSAGLRIGWLAASGPVLERIVREKRNDDMLSSTLTQLIAARYLAGGDHAEQLRRVTEFHRERYEVMARAVRDHLGPLATHASPAGGAHLWLRLRDPIDERDLYSEAVRQGVTFMPGGAMMVERPRATYARVSFGYLAPEDLREGTRRLAAAIRAARPRPRREAMPVT